MLLRQTSINTACHILLSALLWTIQPEGKTEDTPAALQTENVLPCEIKKCFAQQMYSRFYRIYCVSLVKVGLDSEGQACFNERPLSVLRGLLMLAFCTAFIIKAIYSYRSYLKMYQRCLRDVRYSRRKASCRGLKTVHAGLFRHALVPNQSPSWWNLNNPRRGPSTKHSAPLAADLIE